MRAGELSKRGRLQRQKKTGTNPVGENTYTWVDVAWVWAAIEPLTGREYLAANRDVASVSVRIRIRYRSGVLPTMRFVMGDRIWSFVSVLNIDERNRQLHIMANEDEIAVEDEA